MSETHIITKSSFFTSTVLRCHSDIKSLFALRAEMDRQVVGREFMESIPADTLIVVKFSQAAREPNLIFDPDDHDSNCREHNQTLLWVVVPEWIESLLLEALREGESSSGDYRGVSTKENERASKREV